MRMKLCKENAVASIAEKIKAEEKKVVDTRKRIAQMKEQEAKRILRLADKAGFFEIEVSDAAITTAFEQMVTTARSRS